MTSRRHSFVMRVVPALLVVPSVVAVLSCSPAHPGSAHDAANEPPRWLTLPEPPPMPRPDTSGYVASGGARLYFAVFNRGGPAPVMLLHGGLVSSDTWSGEVARLEPTHEVIIMDARGHGRSTRTSEPFTYALFATDALAVLDATHVPSAAIVGWSDGGIVGLLLAIHHPDRVARLFTFGANFDLSGYSDAPPDSAARALGARFRARTEASYRRFSPTPDSFAAFSAALEDLYAREPSIAPAALRTIRVPTTICAGEHEQFITRAHTEKLASLIPGARLVILPDVSHGGPLQDPDEFHHAVAEFLQSER